MPAANAHTPATTETTTGPSALPVSLISRHIDRKRRRLSGGATSAPSVMTMPDPMPLPKLITMATTVSPTSPPVSGSTAIAAPRTSMEGTATASLPWRSITFPDG